MSRPENQAETTHLWNWAKTSDPNWAKTTQAETTWSNGNRTSKPNSLYVLYEFKALLLWQHTHSVIRQFLHSQFALGFITPTPHYIKYMCSDRDMGSNLSQIIWAL